MRSIFVVAVLAAASSVRGDATVDASRDLSVEADQGILRILEPNYNPEDMTKLTSRSVLDALLNRRRSCNPGYGYCSGKNLELISLRGKYCRKHWLLTNFSASTRQVLS